MRSRDSSGVIAMHDRMCCQAATVESRCTPGAIALHHEWCCLALPVQLRDVGGGGPGHCRWNHLTPPSRSRCSGGGIIRHCRWNPAAPQEESRCTAGAYARTTFYEVWWLLVVPAHPEIDRSRRPARPPYPISSRGRHGGDGNLFRTCHSERSSLSPRAQRGVCSSFLQLANPDTMLWSR